MSTFQYRFNHVNSSSYSWDNCYNSKLSDKSKEESYIRFTQDSSIEFQVQSIYLIYTGLIVCTTLNLPYSKKHISSIKSIYSKHSIYVM